MSRRCIGYTRCPPGVFCIENSTLFICSILILITGISFIYFITIKTNRPSSYYYSQHLRHPDIDYPDHKTDSNTSTSSSSSTSNSARGLFPRPNYTFSNIENDVLLNPYKEPVRDDRHLLHFGGNGRAINIQTQSLGGVQSEFRQVGILTKEDIILPLMGRPLFVNRDKWNFYTMNDKANMIKLPMKFKNKDCLSEQGCDNIYNGDQVFVEGYGSLFKATIYENNVMRYLPFF